MSPKKIPLRMCLVCRQKKPKRELLRIVRTVDGNVEVDPTGKTSGRGTYVCKDGDCYKGLKVSAISKALETEVPAELWVALQEDLGTV